MSEPFGRFLVRRGRCSEGELLHALMEQDCLRPNVLTVAMDLGLVTRAQALDVLDEVNAAQRAITEILVEGHYLTAHEHRLVLREVQARTPHIGHMLLMNGLITGSDLRDELAEHRGAVRLPRAVGG